MGSYGVWPSCNVLQVHQCCLLWQDLHANHGGMSMVNSSQWWPSVIHSLINSQWWPSVVGLIVLMVLCIWFHNCWWQPGPKKKHWSVCPFYVCLPQMSPAGAISMMVTGYVRSLNKKPASRTVVSTRPRGSWISGHPMLQCPTKTSSAQAGSSLANQQHPR